MPFKKCGIATLVLALVMTVSAQAAQKKPPLISFLTPSGGEVYIPGQEQVVVMPLNSAVQNVELRLSIDGGVTYPTVIATASNVGLEREKTKTVKFVVPNTPATTCMIKAVGTSKKGNVEAITASFVIGSPFLPPGAVNTTILANNAVETINVLDGAITTAKLADGSVTNPKLAEGAVTNNKVSSEVGGAGGSNATNNFVLAANGAGGAVWRDLSALGITIGNSNITADAVTGDKIFDGTIFSSDLAPLAGITDGQVNDNLTINGGTVNNTPIGGTTPSTGAFTSLSVNSTGSGITFVPNNETISNNTNDIVRLSSNTGTSFDVDMTGSGGAGLSLRGNPASGLFRIEGQSAVAAPGTTVEVRGGQGTAGGALLLRGGAGTATLGGDVTIDPGVSNAGTSGNLNITTPTVVLDSDNVSTNVNIDITARRFPATGSGVLRYDTAGNWQISSDNGTSFNTLLTSASGTFWSRLGNGGTNPATNFIGTTDPTDLFFRVNNAQVMRYIPGSSPTIIGGFSGNSIGSAAVIGATIAGGGSSSVGSTNIVHDRFGTIGGGEGNIVGTPGDAATETHATVAGGFKNSASAIYSAVGGGNTNNAGGIAGTGSTATVAGGESNTASGAHSAIPGGKSNTASGTLSFAAGELNTASGTNSVAIGKNNSAGGNSSVALGERATTASGNANSFIWNDSGTTGFTTTNTNQFWASAANGFWFRGVISAGGNSSTATPPTQVTDANGKVLSSALNTVAVPQGGTGQTSFTTNAVIYGNDVNPLLNTGASSADGQFLQTTTAGAAPTWKTILGVANGGTGLASGTSGGILAYTAAGTLASSGALTNNQLIVGGGAGATPRTLSSSGTATQVLHGGGAGEPTYGAVVLTTDVSGILPVANGGTGDDSVAPNSVFAGPSSGVVDGAPSFRALVGADLPLSGAPYVLKVGDTMTGLLTNSTGTTALALTGTPASNSGASLVQVGSAIVSGNGAANGGTYLGLNAPAAGAGSAADFINFQQNGTDRFRVTGAGAATFGSSGTFGGAVTATSFTGTVATTNLSGFVAVNNGGTGTNTTTGAAQVFAGPTAGAGAPTFRTLVAGDLPGGAAAPYVLDTGDTMTGNLFINAQPAASATASVLGLGNAIANGDATVNGGTYLGLNAPSTGAGSVADFINFQNNGNTRFKVAATGAITAPTLKSADVPSAPLVVSAGVPTAVGNGNSLTLSASGPTVGAGNGGAVSVSAGSAFELFGSGGAITVTAGSAPDTGTGGGIMLTAGSSTNSIAGSITLNPGGTTTGTAGKVVITKNIDLTGAAPTLTATTGVLALTTTGANNINLNPGTGDVVVSGDLTVGANTVTAATFNGNFTGNITGNLSNTNVTITGTGASKVILTGTPVELTNGDLNSAAGTSLDLLGATGATLGTTAGTTSVSSPGGTTVTSTAANTTISTGLAAGKVILTAGSGGVELTTGDLSSAAGTSLDLTGATGTTVTSTAGNTSVSSAAGSTTISAASGANKVILSAGTGGVEVTTGDLSAAAGTSLDLLGATGATLGTTAGTTSVSSAGGTTVTSTAANTTISTGLAAGKVILTAGSGGVELTTGDLSSAAGTSLDLTGATGTTITSTAGNTSVSSAAGSTTISAASGANKVILSAGTGGVEVTTGDLSAAAGTSLDLLGATGATLGTTAGTTSVSSAGGTTVTSTAANTTISTGLAAGKVILTAGTGGVELTTGDLSSFTGTSLDLVGAAGTSLTATTNDANISSVAGDVIISATTATKKISLTAGTGDVVITNGNLKSGAATPLSLTGTTSATLASSGGAVNITSSGGNNIVLTAGGVVQVGSNISAGANSYTSTGSVTAGAGSFTSGVGTTGGVTASNSIAAVNTNGIALQLSGGGFVQRTGAWDGAAATFDYRAPVLFVSSFTVANTLDFPTTGLINGQTVTIINVDGTANVTTFNNVTASAGLVLLSPANAYTTAGQKNGATFIWDAAAGKWRPY